MKKIFYAASLFLKAKLSLSCFILVGTALLNGLTAQTSYYSNFPSPTTSDYQSSKPSGTVCALPNFTNTQNVADADMTNTATVGGTVGVSLVCNSSNQYSLRAKLYFPDGTTSAPIGYYAGFRLRLNTLLSLSTLQSNVTLRTYLAGAPRETQPGNALLGLNALSTSTSASNISFQTTMTFDEVEVIIGTSVLSLNTAFTYDFFYAYASPIMILPLKLSSFSARTEAGNVHLSWTAANETNVATYAVERSSEASNKFSFIGRVDANNTGATVSYSLKDGSVGSGKYLYRLKMTDKDGTVSYSKTEEVVLTNKAAWNVYPTLLLQTGQLQISLPTAGTATKNNQVQVAGLDGKVVGSFTVTNNQLVLPVQSWAKGMYVLKLYQDQMLVDTKKVIVQ